MIDQRKRIFAVNLWVLDLVLTTASFLLAYEIRTEFELPGHIVMPVRVYLWILWIILPTWAILLPAFRVYSEPSRTLIHQILQLSKAIFFAWLVMAAMLYFLGQDDPARLLVLLTLGINYGLLVSYRVVLVRFKKYGA